MLNKLDTELVDLAVEIIQNRYVDGSLNHTVGCALRDKSGKVHLGINLDMDGMHSVCAEQVAFGNALTKGIKEFDTVVAVGLFDGKVSVLAPCGSCRQFMSKYAPNIKVIIDDNGELKSVKFDKLLPHAYKLHVSR